MRAAIDGLRSPYPLGAQLPAVYADDVLMQAFAGGLDDLLAPLLGVLDNLDAYFRPGTAPDDFVDLLGAWTGVEPALVAAEHLREAVALAADRHRRRGTRAGLAAAVRLAFGVLPEITESGGAVWSARPLGPFPGDRTPGLTVTLRVPDPSAVDPARLDAVVAAARPAHLPYRVAVLPERT
ncbi:tail protein [Actinoplanes philippinensis]|uniref:Phage tail protein domain-containing protein n=1 Tax=Actinoplanes philippinensis TaxID=35752 RepID=A0A1I2HGD3_9ACTN|nr:phage tail protein [Actinoplanes philippinensis]GIE81764.1 tail protein [Actinoplanes philippinensis]SFF28598.1 phage tail protein domain-containing protein [Actinoplanes philippinensis]